MNKRTEMLLSLLKDLQMADEQSREEGISPSELSIEYLEKILQRKKRLEEENTAALLEIWLERERRKVDK